MSEIFMCLVEGGRGPKRIHETLEIAMTEAKRLSELPATHKRVFVLSEVAVIEKPLPAAPAAPIITVKKKRLISSPK